MPDAELPAPLEGYGPPNWRPALPHFRALRKLGPERAPDPPPPPPGAVDPTLIRRGVPVVAPLHVVAGCARDAVCATCGCPAGEHMLSGGGRVAARAACLACGRCGTGFTLPERRIDDAIPLEVIEARDVEDDGEADRGPQSD